ncbi:hypothetical protein GCM10010168_52440 [Actinoplanes ianthinogenes]|uniref:Excalibur calcium-binding domain-containing protein n=1 Tax=Actinoplanes ianthinogenes TaxID=122358 RepID=A0ABM7M3W2_9ACTN|nr:excalibur calcium-binding domain-containing protein [Actinoplanes ianthinogenes]BCJ46293.1 hypothetical protein Aiant_69500 [Actinoplanes ianthinogenes]GGR27644.1 hypothetical protein GCM10010168_52440 [Actinoplanes ianthinogenes]
MPYAPPGRPPSRWKPWHKVTLGVVAALGLCVCGVAAFAPDSPKTPAGPESTAAAQQVADSSTAPATEAVVATPTATKTTTPAAPKTTKPKPAPTTTKPVYYANCAAVEAAGLYEIRKGQPGYRKALDRDGDGVACEADDTEPADDDTGDDDGGDSGSGGTDPRFRTCAEANANGYGPYREGVDPEYDWYQDRDGDGEVCE